MKYKKVDRWAGNDFFFGRMNETERKNSYFITITENAPFMSTTQNYRNTNTITNHHTTKTKRDIFFYPDEKQERKD